jgi:hypothetical protein
MLCEFRIENHKEQDSGFHTLNSELVGFDHASRITVRRGLKYELATNALETGRCSEQSDCSTALIMSGARATKARVNCPGVFEILVRPKEIGTSTHWPL